MKITLVACLFVAFYFSMVSFSKEETPLFSLPQGWQKPVYDFKKNPLTPEKVTLGRMLFYDPILSKDNTISCSSCHLSYLAFAHIDHDLSHGINGRIGKRNAPSLMNLAWAKSFMWDGRIEDLDKQSLAPITHPDEMGETMENVVKKLQKTSNYPKNFQNAFGDSLVTSERLLKSLSQFMLTFVSADAKYDKMMRKEAKFNEYEAKGYALFKTYCNSCHTEPLFTNNGFENNGLEPDTTLNDWGRFHISHLATDSLKFKVPSLRNVEVTYPYMHDGRFKNLQMVLFHYTDGTSRNSREEVHQSKTLAKQFKKKLLLTEDDKINLIAFLKTLTDEEFLHNPKFQYLK